MLLFTEDMIVFNCYDVELHRGSTVTVPHLHAFVCVRLYTKMFMSYFQLDRNLLEHDQHLRAHCFTASWWWWSAEVNNVMTSRHHRVIVKQAQPKQTHLL